MIDWRVSSYRLQAGISAWIQPATVLYNISTLHLIVITVIMKCKELQQFQYNKKILD